MKNTIRLLIVLALMMSGLSVLQAQEELVFTLPVIISGDVIEAELNNDITTQMYAFVATAGDNVVITMTQDESTDLGPFLVLLGSAGEVLAVDDDGGDVALSSRIEYTIPVNDTYFVFASSYVFIDGLLMEEGADYGSLPYVFTIEGNNPPAETKGDETPLVIYHGSFQDGVASVGASTPEEPVYFYLFAGTAGESVTVTLSSAEFPPILHVFDPTGARIAMDIDNEGFAEAVAEFTLPEDGTYIVAATDMFFYEAVNYTTQAEDDLAFTGGEFQISLTRGAVKK